MISLNIVWQHTDESLHCIDDVWKVNQPHNYCYKILYTDTQRRTCDLSWCKGCHDIQNIILQYNQRCHQVHITNYPEADADKLCIFWHRSCVEMMYLTKVILTTNCIPKRHWIYLRCSFMTKWHKLAFPSCSWVHPEQIAFVCSGLWWIWMFGYGLKYRCTRVYTTYALAAANTATKMIFAVSSEPNLWSTLGFRYGPLLLTKINVDLGTD